MKILGYPDRFSVAPGETVRFMVSCDGLNTYRADIVRLIHGDTNPAGPGYKDEEIAFYDALAENESARQVMGEPALRVIAHELVTVIKSNVTVDWMHRDSARANIRRHVKRLLRKYGYPPDLQDAAVQNVLQQAEALSAEWAA